VEDGSIVRWGPAVIRKLGLTFWPAEHVEAAVYLHHVLILEDPPDDVAWRDLERAAARVLSHVWESTRGTVRLLARLGDRAGVVVGPHERETLSLACGVPAARVDVDVDAVLADGDAGASVDDLLELARWLDGERGVRVRVKVGGRLSTLTVLVDELAARARDAGLAVRAPERAAPAPPPRQCVFGWERVDLSAAARLFLRESGLGWPTDPVRLRLAYRRCAFLHHPDRNPGDPSAPERFVALGRGYQELKALL
jgi:hypothetical protein